MKESYITLYEYELICLHRFFLSQHHYTKLEFSRDGTRLISFNGDTIEVSTNAEAIEKLLDVITDPLSIETVALILSWCSFDIKQIIKILNRLPR